MMKMLKQEKKKSDSAEVVQKSFSYTIQKQENLKITLKKYSTPPTLPWNGWFNDVELTNTCTIDNMLYVFHILQDEHEDFCNFMKESHFDVNRTLHEIHKCFTLKKWSEGKSIWIQQILNLPLREKVDLLGGEDVFFFDHIKHEEATTYKTVCSNAGCLKGLSQTQ